MPRQHDGHVLDRAHAVSHHEAHDAQHPPEAPRTRAAGASAEQGAARRRRKRAAEPTDEPKAAQRRMKSQDEE
jgi:hypothetical protein